VLAAAAAAMVVVVDVAISALVVCEWKQQTYASRMSCQAEGLSMGRKVEKHSLVSAIGSLNNSQQQQQDQQQLQRL